MIGDVILDVVARAHTPIEPASDTPAAISLVPGGSGANVAAWLGALEAEVIFAGRAGSDSADWHAAALRAHGVEPVLGVDPLERTGVLVSLVGADGERSFLVDRGANARLTRADLPDALLDRAQLVHVSAYAFAESASRVAVRDFLAGATARGIPITVDPGSVALLRGAGPAEFLHWTRGARICFPNAAEAEFLAGTGNLDDALTVLGRNYECVVIKNGAAGALACTQGGARRWESRAAPGTALDTTGAGDAFVAGFLAAYVRGSAVEACLASGVATAARAIVRFGGRPP